jgi:hypothetical protein
MVNVMWTLTDAGIGFKCKDVHRFAGYWCWDRHKDYLVICGIYYLGRDVVSKTLHDISNMPISPDVKKELQGAMPYFLIEQEMAVL